MKNLIFLWILLFCLSQAGLSQTMDKRYTPAEKGTFDYWKAQMGDTAVNFNKLVQEFNSFWKDRTPVKGSGYKQFRRWQIHASAYANPDGSMRLPEDDLSNAMAYNQMYSTFQTVGTWSYVGPHAPIYKADQPTVISKQMGRVSAIGFHPTNPQTIYVGAPLGGLFVSYNNGSSWQNLNTDNISALGVSAIAVHPDTPTTILIGTGDRDSEKTRGKGIYKSTDGGMTWIAKPISSRHDKVVSKILYHPTQHNRLVLAGNYGVYTSSDGGETWSNKLAAYIYDMEQKPGDTILYACSGNVVFRSLNFGKNWSVVDSLDTHRIAIGVSPDSPNSVFLFTTKNSGFSGVYRSYNSGESYWKLTTSGIVNESQGGYNLDMVVDPLNSSILYGGMVNLYKSTDGGHTWVNQEIVTADDQHIFEFNPHNHRLFIGNDSGIWYSDDGEGYTYSNNGLNVDEIYRMDVAAQNPDHIIMGNQDASTFVTNGGPYYSSIGADGMTCKIDYDNEEYVYGSSQEGYIARSTNGGDINAGFHSIISGPYGINQPGNWQTAFLIDYLNPEIMYAGMRDIWRTVQLREPNANNIGWLNLTNGALDTCTVEFIELSRADANTLYVFTDRQTIYRGDNLHGITKTWTKLENPGNNHNVRFESHPTNPNIVYMISGTEVYKSVDKGDTWINISFDLPNLGARSLAYMNGSPDGLYVGTTAGVYYKDTTMTNWVPFKTGLPLTYISDLVINYSTTPAQLFAATFGRGIWKTTVLTSYEPDLIAGSGNPTINGTMVSCINGYQTSNSMATIPEYSIGYYLSSNIIISDGDHKVFESTQTEVNPGLILQSQMPVTDVALAQPEIPTGTYYLGMLLDNHFEVDESTETNNTWVGATQVNIPANPSPPSEVQATDGEFIEKTTITWVNNSNETLYFAVFRATLNLTSLAQQISPATWMTSTTFDDTTASNGQTYYYWVKSSRYSGGNRPSDFSSSNSGWRKLSAPQDLDASDGQFSDKVKITWTSIPGSTYYRVYRSESPFVSEYMYISGLLWISDTTFNDMTAVAGTTYYYWVRAARSNLGSSASGYSESNTGWRAFTSAPDAVATDGTYTDRVDISWNSVSGASYYRLYKGTSIYSLGASPITDWQTATSFSDLTAVTGTIYYYWVKASSDPTGTNSTGFGQKDQGFRNFIPPAGVAATDGTYTGYVQITWNAASGASYYKVYRSILNVPSNSPISSWQTSRKINDYTAAPGTIYYYWVKTAGDTNVTVSGYSASNSGYRKISSPVVEASTGIYTDKVIVNWQSVAGAGFYRVNRATVEDPAIQTTLANWSSSLNNTFTDLTAVLGQEYIYYVAGAVNGSGLRAGNAGTDIGYADACGNLVDDAGYRSINFHGTTLEITQRVLNTGPFNKLNNSQVTIYLENDSPDGTPEATLGTVSIPPLESGEYHDYSFSIDLNTIAGFNFTLGEWHLAFNMSDDGFNCDSDPDDDYLVWATPSFNYTDALHGTYLIGPVSGDFYDISKALEALQERGISDPVTFLVEPGSYLEKLTFTPITGVSASKKIIFKSQDVNQKATIIAYPSETENFTLRFSNSSYITFQDLILTTTGHSNYQSTYGRVIVIDEGSHDLKFRNNTIIGFTDLSHINNDNYVIYANNNECSNIIIDGNVIQNGATGIFMAGINLQSAPMTGIQVIRNTITGFGYTGIWLQNQDHPVITNNLVMQTNDVDYYLNGIVLSSSRNGFNVSQNTITLESTDMNLYGINIDNSNMDGSQPGLISNNFISLGTGSSSLYGMLINNLNKTRILYNSVHLYGNSSPFSTALLVNCQDTPFSFDNSLVNNILYNRIGGYSIAYTDNPFNQNFFYESDFNDLISNGPYLALLRDNPMSSMNEWRSATGFDIHSISVDPGFLSDRDLHATSSVINESGIPRTEVTIDIDSEPRSLVKTDIGADEFTPPPPNKTLNLSVFLEGLYIGLNQMAQAQDENGPHYGTGIADRITVELHSAGNYNSILYSASNVNLSTTGQVAFSIPGTFSSTYYITVKHRNSIEITSASPVSFSGSTISYAFNHPSKVFGGNVILKPSGNYVVYSGDVNQDGLVDSSDMIEVDNDSSEFATGYLLSDVNGDGLVDSTDMILVDNNSGNFVSTILP